MSVPAPREKYSPLILPYPVESPRQVFCRATAPGTLILTGTSSLAIRMVCSSDSVLILTFHVRHADTVAGSVIPMRQVRRGFLPEIFPGTTLRRTLSLIHI